VAAVLVAVQLLIPAAAFANGVPSRFGFHMFSGREGLSVSVLDDAGAHLRIDVDDYVAAGRPELDWLQALPDIICERLEDAAVVTVTSRVGSRTVSCPA
jgi:hypothetical protein